MKRIRTIKPEFFSSEDITSLPIAVRLTFIGLWLYVDDYGNENAKESLIKAAIWPEDDEISTETISEHLLLLAANDQITFYKDGKRNYLAITHWEKHQRVDKPSKSNVPARRVEILATSAREDLAMEGKGERAGDDVAGGTPGGEGETRDASGDSGSSREPAGAPSSFCSKHPGGVITPCRACGNARLARKEWDDQLAAEISLLKHPVHFELGDADDDLPY